MTRRTAQATGRGLEKLLVDKLRDATGLDEDHIKAVAASISGEDIHLSKVARATLGASFECKARAKISVYEWFEQCTRNAGEHTPVLVVKGDRKKPLAILDLDTLIQLLVDRGATD